MPRYIDLTGERFGRWMVQRRAEGCFPEPSFVCSCECGATKTVRGSALRRGQSRSCGCLNRDVQRERMAAFSTTHGASSRPEYQIWKAIKQRCCNPNSTQYRDYGGRGIVVAPEWKNNFLCFLAAVGARPSRGHTLDRIDNSAGYVPGNVRWATRTTQNNNSRKNVVIEVGGRRMTLAEWARTANVDYHVLHRRIQRSGQSATAIVAAAIGGEIG